MWILSSLIFNFQLFSVFLSFVHRQTSRPHLPRPCSFPLSFLEAEIRLLAALGAVCSCSEAEPCRTLSLYFLLSFFSGFGCVLALFYRALRSDLLHLQDLQACRISYLAWPFNTTFCARLFTSLHRTFFFFVSQDKQRQERPRGFTIFKSQNTEYRQEERATANSPFAPSPSPSPSHLLSLYCAS